MKKIDFYYNSADKKTKIHAIKWIPDKEIKAILQISHGVTEHIERYNQLAQYLTDKGILVVGNDHLGHGKSLGTTMYFGPTGSWNYVVEDIHTCKKMLEEEYPTLPYFMLGFSLGSFGLRNYLIDYTPEISGAIIVGTGYNSSIEVALAKFIANSEAKKYGEENTTDKIKKLTFATYNKKFTNPKTDYDWLSLSQKNLDEYTNDPLRGQAMSSGLFRELLNGMNYTCKLKNIKLMNKDTSILFISGDKDPVGGQTKGVDKVYKLFKKSNIKDLTLKYYKDLRHDILHEDIKLEIYEFLYNWMINHIIETI